MFEVILNGEPGIKWNRFHFLKNGFKESDDRIVQRNPHTRFLYFFKSILLYYRFLYNELAHKEKQTFLFSKTNTNNGHVYPGLNTQDK